jgi:hypothetical protein
LCQEGLLLHQLLLLLLLLLAAYWGENRIHKREQSSCACIWAHELWGFWKCAATPGFGYLPVLAKSQSVMNSLKEWSIAVVVNSFHVCNKQETEKTPWWVGCLLRAKQEWQMMAFLTWKIERGNCVIIIKELDEMNEHACIYIMDSWASWVF